MLFCFCIRGSVEGTISSKVLCLCLSMYALLNICVGINLADLKEFCGLMICVQND